MGRKLWGIGGTCLMIMALLLRGLTLLGLLGVLLQRGGSVSFLLFSLALGISLAMYHYKTVFPDRNRARTLARLFEIMVIMLGLLGLLAGIFTRWGSWSRLMVLPLLINLPILNWRHTIWHTIGGTSPSFSRRQEQRLQRAMHYVGEHGVITIPVYCQLTDVPQEMAVFGSHFEDLLAFLSWPLGNLTCRPFLPGEKKTVQYCLASLLCFSD